MSATNVAYAGKGGNICVANNVSATMCPRLPGPKHFVSATNVSQFAQPGQETSWATLCPQQCALVYQGLKGPGKRGHIVADTLLLMMFLGLRKLGNICCGHKMFLNKIRNIFVSRTQNLCPQQMLRTRTNGETFVSATMCPQNVSSFARTLR